MTPAQAAANAANALHSTGPRTPQGKAAVAQNARKHRLSAQYLPLSEEERPFFEELEAGLRASVNPQGALQESIFRELAAAAWKRDIVNRLLAEAGASTESLFLAEPDDRVRRLLRHKADIDRAFNRSLRQLKEIQTAELARAVTGAAPSLANPARFTKQTQSSPARPAAFTPSPDEEGEEVAKESSPGNPFLRH